MNIDFIIDWADTILFLYLFFEVVYLLLLGSVTKSCVPSCHVDKYYRYAVLIPSSFSFPIQDYSSQYFNVFFYNDNWYTKLKELDSGAFDFVIVLGSFVSVPSTLLSAVNNACNSGFKALQLHTILNRKDRFLLRHKARIEELRNGLFKSGRCGIGLSSALDKTNVVVPLEWAQTRLKTERTNLEWTLVSHHVFIKYLCEPVIVAECFPPHFKSRSFKKSMQRLFKYLRPGCLEEIERNLLRLFPSLSGMIAITFIAGTVLLFYHTTWAIKWWILLFFIFFAFSLAMPDYVMEPHKKRKTLNIYRIWKNRQLKRK